MEIEEIHSAEKNDAPAFPKKEEHQWNGHLVSSFQEKRERELLRLTQERASKEIDPQTYFTYRAREEQIKYELDFRQCGVELLKGNFYESLVHYGHALNHIKRRNDYEQKVYVVWLQKIKAQENPPIPDIVFINQGIHLKQLV